MSLILQTARRMPDDSYVFVIVDDESEYEREFRYPVRDADVFGSVREYEAMCIREAKALAEADIAAIALTHADGKKLAGEGKAL